VHCVDGGDSVWAFLRAIYALVRVGEFGLVVWVDRRRFDAFASALTSDRFGLRGPEQQRCCRLSLADRLACHGPRPCYRPGVLLVHAHSQPWAISSVWLFPLVPRAQWPNFLAEPCVAGGRRHVRSLCVLDLAGLCFRARWAGWLFVRVHLHVAFGGMPCADAGMDVLLG